MSTFVHLDSGQRNVVQYPSPADFDVTAKQVSSWWPQARTVRAYPQEIQNKQYEFVTSIKLSHLILPYTAQLANEPLIFVEFHSSTYHDRGLISTIDGEFPKITFVAEWDKTQNNSSAPAWIHYKCNMTQAMRYKRDKPLKFKIVLRDGTVPVITDNTPPVLPNPALQISATFEMIPYIRDDEYINHMVTTLV
jgi:hypothetical protein